MSTEKGTSGFDTISVPPFRLGEWLIQPALHRISNGGPPVQLEPRVMDVLALLASKAGEVISRRELLNTIWSDAIVCEEALTRSISRLRKVLNDDPGDPRFIETIRKSGYRLMPPVTFVNGDAQDQLPESLTAQNLDIAERSDTITTPSAIRGRVILRFLLGILTLAAVLVTAVVLWIRPSSETQTATGPILQSVPFTSYPGREGYPAFSPDGSLVAFNWDGENAEQYDLYVKQRDTDSVLRLTTSSADEFHPTWSPDGRTIAFTRRTATGTSIHTIPAIGGPARRLLAFEVDLLGLDWSPDGQSLVYAMAGSPSQPAQLCRYLLDTQETQVLTHPPNAVQSEFLPAFSPDGQQLAFVRSDPFGTQDIYLLPTTGGEVHRLTYSQQIVTGLTWTNDGEHLVYSTAPMGRYCLWRVSVRDGSQTRLPTHSRYVMRPDIPARGEGMVYEELSYEYDIWRLRLNGDSPLVLDARPLISSTLLDQDGRYAPDGRRIAFLSSRSGYSEVWLCEDDGSDPRQISHFDGARVTTPRWSPDGRRLACSVMRDGRCAIYLLDPEGGPARCVNDAKHNEWFSAWSRDGQWLYYASDKDVQWQIWKVHPDGSEATPVTRDGGRWAKESLDGKTLYFSVPGAPGLWAMPVAGGEKRLLLEGSAMADWSGMVVVTGGIYFILGKDHPAELCHYDFATGDITSLARIPGYIGYHLSISEDGKYLLYDRSERFDRDLVLVKESP